MYSCVTFIVYEKNDNGKYIAIQSSKNNNTYIPIQNLSRMPYVELQSSKNTTDANLLLK